MSVVPVEDVKLVYATSNTPQEWKDTVLPYTSGQSDYYIWRKLAEYNYPKSTSTHLSPCIQIVDNLVENFKKYCTAKGLSQILADRSSMELGEVAFSIRRNIEYMTVSMLYSGLLGQIYLRAGGSAADSAYTGAEVEVIMYNSLINFYSFRYVWGKVLETIITKQSLITLDNGVVVKPSSADFGLSLKNRLYTHLPDKLEVYLSFPLVNNYDKEKLRMYISNLKSPSMVVNVSMGFDDLLAYMFWGHFSVDVFKVIPFVNIKDPKQAAAIIYLDDYGVSLFEKETLSTCNIKRILTKATDLIKK